MTATDLESIAALGFRSKAHWGYSDTEMTIFADELALGTSEFESLLDAQVACLREEIVGYATLRAHPGASLELEHLFVEPTCFGQGIGTLLLRAALERASQAQVSALKILSDPNAVGFYRKHGAAIIGEHQSSIPGRTIPILSLPVPSRG